MNFPFLFNPSGDPTHLIVQDFAIIMVVAAIMIAITYKLKQPMVLGYIVAGMLIGPHTPPFSLVTDINTINTFAEIGIIMLLFVIGTDFPIHRLRSVGRISIVVALAETLGTLILSFFVAQYLRFTYFDSLFLALAMSITSTVVTVRILEEMGMMGNKSSTLLLGISVVEDIIAITILAVLRSMAVISGDGITGVGNSGGDFPILTTVISVAVAGAFIGGTLFLGSKGIPRVIDRIGKTGDYTLLLIVILGLAFGLSFFAKGMGLSVATGAFMAGVLVAESKSMPTAKIITMPLRDMFAAIFFISIGALMDISLVPLLVVPAAILILTSFASKFLIVSGILMRAGYSSTTSLRTGFGMSAARGELSLVVAKGGLDVGAITSLLLPIMGVVTIVTTFIAPYIIRLASRLVAVDKEHG